MLVQKQVCQGRLHPHTEQFDLSSILPPAFKIRDPRLEKNPVISVGIGSDEFVTQFVKTKDHENEIDPI